MAQRGHRVFTIAPRYDQYQDAWDTSVVINVLGEDGERRHGACLERQSTRMPRGAAPRAWQHRAPPMQGQASCAEPGLPAHQARPLCSPRLCSAVRFFHTVKKGVHRVWVDHPWFLAKVWGMTGSKLYGAKSGSDYGATPRGRARGGKGGSRGQLRAQRRSRPCMASA